jgi:hypothetical protein
MNGQLLESVNSINSGVETKVEEAEFVAEGEQPADLGLDRVQISTKDLKYLASLGLEIRDLGILRISRGTLMVHLEWLKTAIRSLTEEISDLGRKPKKTRSDHAAMAQLSRSLGCLSAQLNNSQRLLMEIAEASLAEEESLRPKVKCFAVDEDVRPASPKSKEAIPGSPS